MRSPAGTVLQISYNRVAPIGFLLYFLNLLNFLYFMDVEGFL
jgi:hypothetical protein